MTPLLPAVPGLVVVACVALFALGVRLLRSDAVEGLEVEDLALLKPQERRRAEGRGPVERLAAPLVPLLRRAIGPTLEARLKRMIELAGRPDGATVDSVLSRMASMVVLSVPVGVFFAAYGQPWVLLVVPLAVVVFPLAGITRARRLRQESISTNLPDFLDVLAVTVAAGVGFRAALDTVSRRFGGPLGEEVSLALEQIRNGSSVRDAFEKLRRRNDSEALSQFVSAFLQSEDLGAPLARTLTRISEDTRRASAQAQRQRAARVAPRVTLVTSMVLVPGALALLFTGFILGADLDLGGLLGGLT
ncbi:type II secretion system F family protein [Jannaschia sp. R86511]|uniref:type II secretion system F family protein n=1 Tax=Jannaschia sp. R86511 TaxID=3093853 RepID=UPI0036D23E8C